MVSRTFLVEKEKISHDWNRKCNTAWWKRDTYSRMNELQNIGTYCLSGCEHLDSAGAAEMSEGSLNDFTKRADCYTFLEGSCHSVALGFFSSCFPCDIEALIYLQWQSVHVSHVQVCLLSLHAVFISLCMHRSIVPLKWCTLESQMSGPRCCLHALTKG